MNTPRFRFRFLPIVALALSQFVPAALPAQSAARANSTTKPKEDELIVLSPFTVNAEQDTGYRATSTLSGTRIKTSLRDIATSIQAITPEFLEDTGITKVTELLQYTTSTEVTGGAGGNFTNPSLSAPASYADDTETRQAVPSTRVRGLADASIARNLFPSSIPFDSYNLSRVEINRGANSVLFGLGSPAGIINYTTTEAMWRDENKVEVKIDNYGTFRSVADFNRVLLKDKLAVRVIGLKDDTKYRQDPTFRNDHRVYGTVTFKPFKDTTLVVNYEKGDINSTLPRSSPPHDYFTQFFTTGKNYLPNNTDLRDLPATLNNTAYIQIDSGQGSLFVINDPNSSGTNQAFLGTPGTITTPVLNPTALNPARANSFQYRRVAMQNGREFLAQVFGDPLGPQAYLLNLVDPSVFDFFNNAIDGRASSQYGRIEAFNAALRQEFFDGQAGIELGFDHQSYDSGYIDALDGIRGNALMLDISQGDFAYATPGNPASGEALNPNFLRPLVGSRTSLSDRTNTDETLRATGFLRHDFAKQSNSFLGKLLGQQNLTMLASSYQNDSSSSSGVASFMDYDQLRAIGISDANARSNAAGGLGTAFYLGDSVAARTTASGLNLQGYKGDLVFPTQVSLNYGDAATKTIKTATIDVHNIQNEPHSRLYSGLGVGRDKLDTLAAVLQSYWWDGAFVSTVGFRKDKVERYTTGTLPTRRPDLTYDGKAALSDTPGQEKTGRTKSYSGVLKVNKLVGRYMPSGVDLDLHYGWSENFQGLSGGRDIKGGFYDAPFGETKEMGFSVGLFDQKLFLRANWFKTTQSNLPDDPGGAWANLIGQMIHRFYENQTVAQLNAAGFALPPEITASGAVTISNPDANGYSVATTVFTPGDVKTAVSKGMELEATYNITPNWRMAVNVAKIEAAQSGIGANTQAMVDFIDTNWFNKPSVAALFLNTGGSLDYVSGWKDRGVTNFQTAQEQDGASNPQIHKWRVNLITNYTFPRHSRLKGFGVGGGIRYQDKGFLGFVGKPNPADPLSYIPDVSKPQYGPSETQYDFWVSYERKILNDKVLWKLQLNIRNAFTGNKLIPVQAQLVDLYSQYSAYDAYKAYNYDLVRIAAPRVIELRSIFKF